LKTKRAARLAEGTAGRAGFFRGRGARRHEGLFAGLEYPLDVAVIDLGLPNLPGLEVIRRLRAARKTYPILILTARDNWQDKVEGLQAGRMTTSPSRFTSRKCWRGCRRCCAGRAAGRARSSIAEPWCWTRARRP